MSRVRELEKGKGPIMLYSVDRRMMALTRASWKVYKPTEEIKFTSERLLL